MKKTIKYLIYTIALFAYILISQYFLLYLQKKMATFSFSPVIYLITIFVVYLLLGALLGIEYFFKNKAKEGSWQINLEKLLLIGIPALAFSYIPLYIKLQQWLHIPINESNQAYIICTIILGYTIITSFERKE
jgi:hypothetical protein